MNKPLVVHTRFAEEVWAPVAAERRVYVESCP